MFYHAPYSFLLLSLCSAPLLCLGITSWCPSKLSRLLLVRLSDVATFVLLMDLGRNRSAEALSSHQHWLLSETAAEAPFGLPHYLVQEQKARDFPLNGSWLSCSVPNSKEFVWRNIDYGHTLDAQCSLPLVLGITVLCSSVIRTCIGRKPCSSMPRDHLYQWSPMIASKNASAC